MSYGDTVKKTILDAGLKLWPNAKTADISKETGMNRPTICYHFKASELSDAIACHAVTVQDLNVVAQLIASRHPVAQHISPDLRSRALAAL